MMLMTVAIICIVILFVILLLAACAAAKQADQMSEDFWNRHISEEDKEVLWES